MNIQVSSEKTADDKLTCKVVVPAAEVDKAVKDTYADIATRYRFQGFRKGHVPRPVIDGMVGRQAVLSDATNTVLNALDPELVGEVLATMKAVAATGITMVVVTHEISFAKEVADRVVYMESGVIVEEGTPKQMLEFPKNEKTIRFLRTLLNNSIEYNI